MVYVSSFKANSRTNSYLRRPSNSIIHYGNLQSYMKCAVGESLLNIRMNWYIFIKSVLGNVNPHIFCFFFFPLFQPISFFFLLQFFCLSSAPPLLFLVIQFFHRGARLRGMKLEYQPCYGSWLSGVDRSRDVIDEVQLVAYWSYRTTRKVVQVPRTGISFKPLQVSGAKSCTVIGLQTTRT